MFFKDWGMGRPIVFSHGWPLNSDAWEDECGDPSQARRTWVLLAEAAEGGWGIAGTTFGREEFTALAARPRPTGVT